MSPHRPPTRLLVRFAAVLAGGMAAFVPRGARAQSRPIRVADMALEVRLAAPTFSPDGRWIALVESRPDYDRDRWAARLVLVNAASGESRALSGETGRIASPRWSPDGRRLAFLSPDSAGKPQVFVLAASGGQAERLTNAPRGVLSFAWDPRKSQLAYATEDPAWRSSGEEYRPAAFEAGNNGYLAREAARPVHIWLVSAAGGSPRRLTSGLAGVAAEGAQLAWSPDGRYLAFLGKPRPESGEMAHGTIETVDVVSGARRTVAPSAAFSVWIGFSPDGRLLAYKRERGDVPGFTPAGIFVAPTAAVIPGGADRDAAVPGSDATADIDRDIFAADWLPSGRALLLQGQDGTNSRLWLQPLDGPARPLSLGAVQPGAFSIGPGGQVAFVGSEPRHPAELYVLASADAKPRRLTHVNDALAARRLGRVDTIAWQGPEGQREDGIVTYPPDFDATRKYPLVLNIHGGPMMASIRGFSLRNQLLAAQGWIVLNPNYRGSSNLGAAYQRAIVNDPGEGPGRDVMRGVAALQAAGNVDTTRMAISGWSYGGFMTVWVLGHFPVWRAAVAGAAVTDWFDYYDLADNNIWVAFGLGGSPWTGRADVYRAGSPITYASRIRAPTLILSDVFDTRVPVTQSYKLFHALRDNGVETRFVLFPIAGHVPADPLTRRDVNRRWIAWLAEHLESHTVAR